MSKAYLRVNGCLKLCKPISPIHRLEGLSHLPLVISGLSQGYIPGPHTVLYAYLTTIRSRVLAWHNAGSVLCKDTEWSGEGACQKHYW